MISNAMVRYLNDRFGLTPDDRPGVDKPRMCSAYVGLQPNGERRFLVTVAQFEGETMTWDIIRLDKWGGIGARAPWKSGTDTEDFEDLARNLKGIDRRDGYYRQAAADYLNLGE